MKKLFCLFVATIFFILTNIAQEFTIVVKNSTNLDFTSKTLFDHGVGMIPNFLGEIQLKHSNIYPLPVPFALELRDV